MRASQLRSPSGEVFDNPSEAQIDSVLSLPQSEWERGCGDAAFILRSDSGSAMLLLLRTDKAGYHLQHYPETARHDYFLSIGSGDMSDRVAIVVGGEETTLPAGVFVDRDSAATAIREFLATGERTSAFPWENRRNLDWPVDDE